MNIRIILVAALSSLSISAAVTAAGFDRRFGHSERFEKSAIHIFLSYIFLFRFCQQKNVRLRKLWIDKF